MIINNFTLLYKICRISLHLFQLRLLQRRMMHDAWSMFHSPRCIINCSKSCKLCARNEPRNLESKRCWRFYAQQNVKTMYSKTLNPIHLMLLNKEASNFLLWDFKMKFFSSLMLRILAGIWLESSLEFLFTSDLHYFNEREQD